MINSQAIPKDPELYGLMAEFEDPDELVEKTKRAYQAGYRRMDAFTPFPVHGLAEAMGLNRNWVPYIVLLGAILGGVAGFALQYYTSVIDYPINIGGRPLNSWPAFMIVTFEAAVLGAVSFGVFGMLALNKLPMPHHPVFSVPQFRQATRDRFFLCIMVTDPQFDLEQTRSFLTDLEPLNVEVIHQSATKIYD